MPTFKKSNIHDAIENKLDVVGEINVEEAIGNGKILNGST